MKKQTVEELVNKIEFLKKALEFYANKDNYNQNIPANNELCSKVELDEGNQARYALDQIKNLDTYMSELEKKVDELLKTENEEIKTTDPENIGNIMAKVNNIINKYKK